jgi:1-acyl-sn-glycerol-3-phosphate acyltransferase
MSYTLPLLLAAALRRSRRPVAFFAASALGLGLAAAPAAAASTVPGTDCPFFPENNWFQADISKLPVHKQSKAWMKNMSSDRNLHPDFGPSFGEIPVPYGIPITVVDKKHKRVEVKFFYASQSDRVRYPLGGDTKVEGGQYKEGDRHTVIVDKDSCTLYETWATSKKKGKWSAGSGAVWDLESDKLRRDGWTSADAAGLPILPLLLRYEEVGKVDHAIRFTTDVTDKRYLWPARHQAGSVKDSDFPPMGARFRLKASYEISPKLRKDTQAVLRAMKTYGLVLADNGSPWYFQGTSDERWKSGLMDELKQIPASAFEAVDTSSLMVSKDSMLVKTPE